MNKKIYSLFSGYKRVSNKICNRVYEKACEKFYNRIYNGLHNKVQNNNRSSKMRNENAQSSKKWMYLVLVMLVSNIASGCMPLVIFGILAGGSDLIRNSSRASNKKELTEEGHRSYVQAKIEHEIYKTMPDFLQKNSVFYKKYKLYVLNTITENEKEDLEKVCRSFKKVTLIITKKLPSQKKKQK